MKKSIFRTTAFFLVGLFVLLFASAQPAMAKRRVYRKAAPKEQMPADKRPWAGTPWLVCGVLAAGATVLGFKNARRSFKD